MSTATNYGFEHEQAMLTKGEALQIEETYRNIGRSEAWALAQQLVKYNMIDIITDCSVYEAMAKVKEDCTRAIIAKIRESEKRRKEQK